MSLRMEALKKSGRTVKDGAPSSSQPVKHPGRLTLDPDKEPALFELASPALEETAAPVTVAPREPAVPEHQQWSARTVFLGKEDPGSVHRHRWIGIMIGSGVLVGVALCLHYAHFLQADPRLLPMPPAPPAETPAPEPPPVVETVPLAEIMSPPLPVAANPLPKRRSAISHAKGKAAQEALGTGVTRRRVPLTIGPLIAEAYAAYQRGDLEAARAAYTAALKGDHFNRDALLGLAAVAARQGHRKEARQYYRQILDRAPHDMAAHAGLLDLDEPAAQRLRESRIKSLLARSPDAIPLHRVLGHLYAREQRWPEAHAAYTAAFSLHGNSSSEPAQKDPDLAFNVAVTLEHLGRHAQARDYYHAALAQAAGLRVTFDPAVAQARLLALAEKRGS